jgi:hypothetical protein
MPNIIWLGNTLVGGPVGAPTADKNNPPTPYVQPNPPATPASNGYQWQPQYNLGGQTYDQPIAWNMVAVAPSGTGPSAPAAPDNPSPNATPGPETTTPPAKGPNENPIVQPEGVASKLFGVNPTLPTTTSPNPNIKEAGFGSGWIVILFLLVLILSPIKMTGSKIV